MISHRHRYLELIQNTQHVQWEPQSAFLHDQNGGLLVDFVGRFEAYESSLRRVLSRVAVSTTTVPHEGRGKRGPYREYYDAESMEIVASSYVTDIASFGYSFDGGLGQR